MAFSKNRPGTNGHLLAKKLKPDLKVRPYTKINKMDDRRTLKKHKTIKLLGKIENLFNLGLSS